MKDMNNDGKIKSIIIALGVAVLTWVACGAIVGLIRDVAFVDALIRPYNAFLAGLTFVGTYTALIKKRMSN